METNERKCNGNDFYQFKVILNLCFSNLLSAVVVKSISIVHNAYAGGSGLTFSITTLPQYTFLVASNVRESNIAFCILYTWGWRLTWAVLPFSIVAMSWLSVLPRFRRLQVRLTTRKIMHLTEKSQKSDICYTCFLNVTIHSVTNVTHSLLFFIKCHVITRSIWSPPLLQAPQCWPLSPVP